MAQWNKYEATAARKHGRPGREIRPKSITIDVHSHVGVPRAAELVKPHLAATAMPLVTYANAETKALNQKQEADIGARASLEQRLADLDAMGLDMQVIKPPPPQCYYARAARDRRQGRADGQRRHRRVRGPQARPPQGLRHRADARRQRGRQGARALRHQARLQGRADPHQRRRQGAVRPRLRAVLEEGRGAGRARRHPSQRLHRSLAAVALLLQQRHRQPAGDDDRPALPDLRRRAGAPSQPEDPGRARRRLSRELLGPHRSRLGRALGFARRPAATRRPATSRRSTSTPSCSPRTSCRT